MEQGELEASPDVVLLDDDDSMDSGDEHNASPKSPHTRHDEEEEEIGPDIKPPQAKIKKDKHKHKHRREKKRSMEQERDKYSSNNRRPEQSRGSNKQRDERSRDKDRHVDRKPRDLRERLQQSRDGRNTEEVERRKRSMQERERLEKLEKERHRLEKERKRQYERIENQEKLDRTEREWDRQKREQRAQRIKDESVRRKAPNRHVDRVCSEVTVDKRRAERDKGGDRRPRSRSPQRHRAEEDRPRRPRDRDREREGGRPREDERRVVKEEEEEIEEEEEEVVQEEEPAEVAHESSSEAEEESASESGSEESESSSSEQEDEGKETNDKSSRHDKHPGKLKSKFESESEEGESEHESDHRVSDDDTQYIEQTPPESPVELLPDLPPYFPAVQGCRNVEEFNCLNRIEEGTYGVVYRARDKKTDEIVALKRLKMEKEKEGFPITSLREINTLLKAQHPNIVTVREIVVGSNMDRIYIVMDYVEHDLKSLMEIMKEDFLLGEVKTLMIQLLRGVLHLHDNWIIHRDLKTSNLLFSHKGILKIGDFGLAREYGSPLKQYTPIVVTLWYRAPELLLACKKYSTAIDLWSVGCIMAELLTRKALFPGKSEIDELNRIFKELGTPNEKIWPDVSELKGWKTVTFAEYPYNQLRNRLGPNITDKGFDIINKFLTYDPKRRIKADEALKHEWFVEPPHPVDPSMFPTWPAKSEQTRRTTSGNSPKPPSGGKAYSKLLADDDEGRFHLGGNTRGSNSGPGFALKF